MLIGENKPKKPDSFLKTILVVDDDSEVLMYLTRLLKNNNYKVIETRNSEEACTLAEGYFPDVILMDVMMPGFSGYEVCKRLRQNSKTYNIPVVFISSMEPDGGKIAEALNIGANDFIQKPFNEEELLARIGALIRGKAQQDQMLLQNKIQILLETVGATAHEINQPLTSIICHTELMLRKLEADNPLRQRAEIIAKSAKEIAKIIKKLQEIKRYETKEYTRDVYILDIDRSSKTTTGF